MAEIRIRLIGNVAFENDMKLSEGFRCDVPVDQMGVPYIPIARLLPASVLKGRHVGFAFPEGYLGFVRQVESLARARQDMIPLISDYFTDEKMLPGTGEWIRYLRAGQDFYASVKVGEADREAFERALESVKHIGIRRKDISGEVECSLCEKVSDTTAWKQPTEGLVHDRLEYSITPITPLCIHAPYDDEPNTITYVPGMVFRDTVEKLADADMKDLLSKMVFSNAYISNEGTRLLPLPLCMSLVKLDKKQLHYRLSPGKDPSRVEQDVGVGDAFARNFENMLTVYTKPETERIVSKTDKMVDALRCGQAFRGEIYGSDADLRKLFAFLKEHPQMSMGSLTQEGFGEVYISVAPPAEASIRAECLARRFDISCLSHTLILNDKGMQDTSAEGFLREIERLLKAPGKLKIVGRYVDVYMDYSKNLRWNQEGMVSRCLAKGSVMRLETLDGQPIDISPLLHAFIGERTRDGYGEIMAYPALDVYYRAAEQKVLEKYQLEYPLTNRIMYIVADLIHHILDKILEGRIKSLAVVDRWDEQGSEKAEDSIPLETLRNIRDLYDPNIPYEELTKWYQDGLKEEKNGFLSYK
ncbi:MAG: hypothetical protein IJ088_10875 [Clostridia bacterium]|nr:hypothetical protein [Clostridia bacterium]